METKERHTITQLYKPKTIHSVVSYERISIVISSLDFHSGSKSAELTLSALMQQVTVIGPDEVAVPAKVLKRVADQIELRARTLNMEISGADALARAVCRCSGGVTMTGVEVAAAKAAYVRKLVGLQAGEERADNV